MGIKVDISQVEKWLEDTPSKAELAIRMYAQEGAKKMQNYAKINRPWTDRTGWARQRLVGWVERLSDVIRIYIGHGVNYGIYLELAHEKRYAILQKTVNALSVEIMEGFKNLLGKLK